MICGVLLGKTMSLPKKLAGIVPGKPPNCTSKAWLVCLCLVLVLTPNLAPVLTLYLSQVLTPYLAPVLTPLAPVLISNLALILIFNLAPVLIS